jgi:acyl carrier protein
MHSETELRVIEFVARQCRVKPEKLDPNMTLLDGLGVDGDDAFDFFTSFSNEFGVDLSGLNLNDHFGPEGWHPGALIQWLKVLLPRKKRSKDWPIAVRLSDLVKATEAEKWVVPSGNA